MYYYLTFKIICIYYFNATEYFVSPKIHMLKCNPQHDIIWRWVFGRQLGHEGGALVNEIMPL